MRLRRVGFPLVLLCAACTSGGSESPFALRVSPIAVIATEPAAGANGVPVDVVLEAEFGGEVDPVAIVQSFRLLVGSSAGTPVLGVPTYQDRLLRFDPTGVLLTGQLYTAQIVRGVPDSFGRPLAQTSWSFTTRALPPPTTMIALVPDPTPPRINVPLNFLVRIAFSEPLTTSNGAVSQSIIQATQTLGTMNLSGPITYDAASRALVFRPTTVIEAGSIVTVNVPGPIADIYGRSVSVPPWNFTIGTSQDAARPVLGGTPVPAETPAGTIRLALPASTDADWFDAELVYEGTVARRRQSLPPPLCNDPFDPQTFRVAELGSGQTMLLESLPFGGWDVILEAEDGAGRRSLAAPAVFFTVQRGAVTFDADIRPILDDSCALVGCHTGSNPPGRIDLTGTKESISNAVSDFQTLREVEPFCLERSYLFRKIEPGYEMEGGLMPPPGVDVNALSRSQRALFRAWIEQGAN